MNARLDDSFSRRDLPFLRKKGIETIADLFRFFPRRHLAPGRMVPLEDMVAGEQAFIQVLVRDVSTKEMPPKNPPRAGRAQASGPRRPKTLTKVRVDDGQRELTITFFNQQWLQRDLKEGMIVVFGGKVDYFRGQPTLASPVWLNKGEHDSNWDPSELNKPFPIYPNVKGINQVRLWRAIKVLLDVADDEEFLDPLPEAMRTELGLPDLRTALNDMHRPGTMEAAELARERWKWEEALALQVELTHRRTTYAQLEATPLLGAGARSKRFDAALPFTLTSSQEDVGREIAADLAGHTAMHRLLHGDVGSGKTVVALRAMLTAVDSGAQAAMLAPTEVLATQHYRSIAGLLGEQMALSPLLADDDQVRVALLTGSMPAKDRKQVALDLATGQIDIIVGTHALLSETTIFDELGLIVVDEQHRFGVEQREALRAKAGLTVPHTLVMSATPIPRTVAMTMFADLDLSTLHETPTGPKNLTTYAVSLKDHSRWLARIHQLLAETAARDEGGFVVAPRIENTEVDVEVDGEVVGTETRIGVEEIKERMERLPETKHLRIGLMHGKLPAAEKDRVMTDFREGRLDALVATTVIEVGVDVPRASMMIIHEADHFGVAQLHQLRGRVGRDGRPAVCFLLSNRSAAEPSFERLKAVAGTLNGFELADFDLDSRGEGDVLGSSQWGGSSLKHLSVLRDVPVIQGARRWAEEIVAADPGLDSYPVLATFIRRILPAESAHFIEAS